MTERTLTYPTEHCYNISDLLDRWCNLGLSEETICIIGRMINNGDLLGWMKGELPVPKEELSSKFAGDRSTHAILQVTKCSFGYTPDDREPLYCGSDWLKIEECLLPGTEERFAPHPSTDSYNFDLIQFKQDSVAQAEQSCLEVRYPEEGESTDFETSSFINCVKMAQSFTDIIKNLQSDIKSHRKSNPPLARELSKTVDSFRNTLFLSSSKVDAIIKNINELESISEDNLRLKEYISSLEKQLANLHESPLLESLPEGIHNSISVFTECWKDLDPTMRRPRKNELESYIRSLGVTEKTEIEAIIKLSIPEGERLGGKPRHNETIPWKVKKYR
ncbi:MAG: hypothetical protein GYB20_02105 [Oceanospirillales bacterium]|nr:hypothetical protein [Oceanospirillales bacterium]